MYEHKFLTGKKNVKTTKPTKRQHRLVDRLLGWQKGPASNPVSDTSNKFCGQGQVSHVSCLSLSFLSSKMRILFLPLRTSKGAW